MQFLRAVSHSVGDHVLLPEDVADDSDAEDDDECRNDNDSDQPQSAVSVPQAQDLCEMCLVQQRDARLAFVPCACTNGSVHPAWHNWNNRLAVARYAA